MTLNYFFAIFFALLLSRTLAWHLQSWQIREYRWDRMRDFLATHEGQKSLWNLWFFRGIFPRPRLSLRLVFILILLAIFLVGIFFILRFRLELPIWFAVLFLDRVVFVLVFLAVLFSHIPNEIIRQILFLRAKCIIKDFRENFPHALQIIAITGSYGKSTTKDILSHIFRENFHPHQVLTTPENNNTEVAIARLIISNKKFFTLSGQKFSRKFFICEMGAYKRGEIARICSFLCPQVSVITSIEKQHLSLFGSLENIALAKLEIAQAASEIAFVPDKTSSMKFLPKIKAKIQIHNFQAKKLKCQLDSFSLNLENQAMSVPWSGGFFAENVEIAYRVARHFSIPAKIFAKILLTTPPPKKALHAYKTSSNFWVLSDLYSSNLTGTLAAIDHLSLVSGKKTFIGVPLRELGDKATESHEQIFLRLKKIKAEVLWLKSDHADRGKKILAKNFIDLSQTSMTEMRSIVQSKIQTLKNDDGVLLEGRLPSVIVNCFPQP